MNIILESLYLMLPAYFANMAPVIFKWIPFGELPLDFSRSWRGKRIFGDNKTFRGFIAGIFVGIFVVALQKGIALLGLAVSFSLLPYETFNIREIFLFGFALGAGAMFGDLIKSFFKRRLGIASGQPWIPFDQIDMTLGALAGLSFLYIPSVLHCIIIILSGFLSFPVNIIAYFLHLKKVWW